MWILPDYANVSTRLVGRFNGRSPYYWNILHRPVSQEQLAKTTPAQAARCRWRRCYKFVSLLHTNETGEFFVYAGLDVVPGNVHECPVLWKVVGTFVGTLGKGIIKHLLLDRGFIDGEAMGRAKQEYGIDITIGVRHSMDIYEDAVWLATLSETAWQPYVRAQPVAVPEKGH